MNTRDFFLLIFIAIVFGANARSFAMKKTNVNVQEEKYDGFFEEHISTLVPVKIKKEKKKVLIKEESFESEENSQVNDFCEEHVLPINLVNFKCNCNKETMLDFFELFCTCFSCFDKK